MTELEKEITKCFTADYAASGYSEDTIKKIIEIIEKQKEQQITKLFILSRHRGLSFVQDFDILLSNYYNLSPTFYQDFLKSLVEKRLKSFADWLDNLTTISSNPYKKDLEDYLKEKENDDLRLF